MTPRATRRIVHISTVHSALDPRVRLKELRTIAEAGLEAHFVTADPLARENGDGVIVHRALIIVELLRNAPSAHVTCVGERKTPDMGCGC